MIALSRGPHRRGTAHPSACRRPPDTLAVPPIGQIGVSGRVDGLAIHLGSSHCCLQRQYQNCPVDLIQCGGTQADFKIEAEDMIRDFIYLDAERLRSYAAQVFGGVPEETSKESGHEAGGAATAEAGLFRFLRAQGEVDYRYHRSATETRSMHHHVYSLFEQELSDSNLITDIDRNFDYETQWEPETFEDGSFMRARGLVRCTDYGAAVQSMSAFPAVLKSFKAIQLANIKSAADSGDINPEDATNQRRELNEMEKGIKDAQVNQLVHLGEVMYGSGDIRIKVRPAGAPSDHILAGKGRAESFLNGLGAGGVTQSPPVSEWVVVGQVSSAQDDGDLTPMPTGNGMEDAIEQMNSGFRELVNAGTSAVFPALEFVPLAIYREISTS